MTYRVRVIPKKKNRNTQRNAAVQTPCRIPVVDSCLTYPLLNQGPFCDLPQPVRAALDAISSPASYPKDAILFVEGQEPRGVFVLCNGRVKLYTNSADGKSIIVRLAQPGELVGLPGTLSGKPYELTGEALEPVQANFIARDAFLQFLRERPEVALWVTQVLSQIYHAILLEIRYLGFSGSSAEKLARFLLDLPATPAQNNGHLRAALTLTHKEIAEMIGASRETVTRLFAHFKRRGLIEVHGSNVLITDKGGMQKLLGA